MHIPTGILLDIIGVVGDDQVLAEVAGVTDATKDHTLKKLWHLFRQYRLGNVSWNIIRRFRMDCMTKILGIIASIRMYRCLWLYGSQHNMIQQLQMMMLMHIS